MENTFFNRTPEETLKAVESAPTGLTSAQAAERLERFGKNTLAEGKKKSGLQVILEQFKNLLVVILLAALWWFGMSRMMGYGIVYRANTAARGVEAVAQALSSGELETEEIPYF